LKPVAGDTDVSYNAAPFHCDLFRAQVLTLASNERIPLTPSMRLLFEISNLRTATPATVSRAGILYLNPADLGWNPVVCVLVFI